MHPRGNILARLPLTLKPLDYQMFGRVSGASLVHWLLWALRVLPEPKEYLAFFQMSVVHFVLNILSTFPCERTYSVWLDLKKVAL